MSSRSTAEFFDDNAVYGRTHAGQRELISPTGQLEPVERRLLAVLTGHTPLGVLARLTGNEPELAEAIGRLQDKGFIVQEGGELSWSSLAHDESKVGAHTP